MTKCTFCHVAVVIRLPELPHTPLLIEANPQAAGERPSISAAASIHLTDVRSRLGNWMTANPGNQAVTRKLEFPSTSASLTIANLLDKLLAVEHPASLVTGDVTKDVARMPQLSAMIESLYSKQFVDSMARANMHEGLAALHAGEVAALALNALGALDSSALPSATTVKDFSELPPLQPGWTLGAKVKVALG